MEVVVWTDAFEEVAGHFGHSIKIGSGLGFVLGIGLLRRGTECFVGLPIGFLALTAAVPLVVTFGAAFERFVRRSFVAFGAGFLSGVHGQELVE